MSIFLEPCDHNKDGFVIEYAIIQNKIHAGALWYCPIRKRWQIISTADDIHLTLIDIAETWSILIDRLDLEKAQ